MKAARLFGLVLVAVFALTAMIASTASAIPTFRLPITLRGFTALSLTSVLRTAGGTSTITCSHDVVLGRILDDDHLLLIVHFLNCTAAEGAHSPCTVESETAGVKGGAGLILTNVLLGLLGLLHIPGANSAGILIAPLTGKGFVKLLVGKPCEINETEAEGNTAGLFSPTGKKQDSATITIRPVSTTGGQEITLILTLAGAVTVKLSAFGVGATEETVDHVLFEEAIEVV